MKKYILVRILKSSQIYNLYKLLKKKYKKMNIYLCLPYPMDKSLNTKLTEKYDIPKRNFRI